MIKNSNKSMTPSLRASKISLTGRLYHGVLMGLAMLCLLFSAAGANAACGAPNASIKPMAWNPQLRGSLPNSSVFNRNDASDPITGMWHVLFNAQSLNGQPFSGVIDNSIVVWHSDGTEIMNSSRPAQDGNFCLGIWTNTGSNQYHLNHIAWAGNDPANAPNGIGNPEGGTQIEEWVALNPNGKTYSGTFTLKAYDTDGNPTVSFAGNVTATRVTTSTSITSLF